MPRKVRVPLVDESGPRVGYKKLPNGNYEVAVIRGKEIIVFELPPDAWKEIKKKGYIELQRYRK